MNDDSNDRCLFALRMFLKQLRDLSNKGRRGVSATKTAQYIRLECFAGAEERYGGWIP